MQVDYDNLTTGHPAAAVAPLTSCLFIEEFDMHLHTIYLRQSPITSPGKYASLYNALPYDVPGIAEVVRGLLIAPYGQKLHGVSGCATANNGFGYRSVEQILERLIEMNDAPLTRARPPAQRLAINCRNFATLFVSMLRFRNIPARVRIGFAGYLDNKLWYEHRITEYMNMVDMRWLLADAMMDSAYQQAYHLNFDTLNLSPYDPFRLSGKIWLDARAGKIDPQRYADSPTDLGMPVIRYALLHDFDAMNNHPVMGCDSWHALQTKPDAELTESDYALLDEIAAAVLDADTKNGQKRLLALYAESDYGQTMTARLQSEGLAAS